MDVKKNRAIIHCDKYTPYPLFVIKDKTKHKENHVDDLKTIEEDCDTFSRCKYKSFAKGDITLEPQCQVSQHVCDKH